MAQDFFVTEGNADMLKKWNDFWKAFIPQRVSNACVLWVMQVLSCFGRVSKKQQEQNECNNCKYLPDNLETLIGGKYIENQNDWHEVWFGQGKNHTMSHSGCGIIAAYNALTALEETEDSETKNHANMEKILSLIRFFEQNGAVLGGRIGIAPKAIAKFFEKQGYDVTFTKCNAKTNETQINILGDKSDVTIITIYNNRKDICGRIHNICVTKKQGKYYIHNAGRRKSEFGNVTLWDAIMNSASAPKVICVIGICKRENNHINS